MCLLCCKEKETLTCFYLEENNETGFVPLQLCIRVYIYTYMCMYLCRFMTPQRYK